MALKDRLYPCSAASPLVQGGMKQAQLVSPARDPHSPGCHLPARWGQGFGPSPKREAFPGVTGRKEKGERGEGDREGAGARGWGTPQRGSRESTKFAGWVGNHLQTIAGYLEAPAHLQNFCPPQGCVSGQQQAGGAQGISHPPYAWGHPLPSPVSQPHQHCPGKS